MQRTIFTFAAIMLLFSAFSTLMAQETDAQGAYLEEVKRGIFRQIMTDSSILGLMEEIRRDPSDQTRVDTLLIRLAISPLEMFRIRMETSFQEYAIPRQVWDLHQRWLKFHPVSISGVDFSPLFYTAGSVDSSIMTLAATVGTNQNADAPNYQGEIQIAVNRNNTQQLVAGANTWDSGGACGAQTQAIFYTSNQGTTWGYTCAPSVGAYGLSCPSGGVPLGSDPAVYWDNSNNVFFNYMLLCCDFSCQLGFGNPTSSLVVAKSTNGGATWSGHGVIVNNLNNASAGLDDKQFYAIDTNPSSPYYGRHYQCWDRSNDELFAYSTNGGATWTTNLQIPKGASGDLDLGCEMAIGANGTIHMIFDGLVCGSSTCSGEKTYYTRSTDGGSTWSTPVLIKSHNLVSFSNSNKVPAQDERGINPFGAIDIDRTGGTYNGRLYVVYSDSASTSTMSNSDIFLKYSTDNGATWSSEIKINDDTTSTSQFHPFLAVDQTNGHVIVGWQDARNDSGNKRIDYYMSRSTNGGLNWEPNIKVSQPSSAFPNNSTISYSDESSNNSGNNPNQYGEYLGVDAHGGKAFMAWTDTREYFPNSTSDASKENMGFAVVDFGSSCTPPGTPTLNSPANGATGVSTTPTLDWSDVTGATSYDVQVCSNSTCSTVVASANVASSTWTVSPALSNGTTYYWRARANNGCGAGSYTSTFSFTTVTSCTLPAAPALSSPANGATGQSTTPVLDWTDVSGATSYDVQVCSDSACASVVRSANVASSTWTVSPALSGSTTYYWRVRTNNSCGSSSFTSTWTFTTAGGSCSTSSQLFVNPGFESGSSSGWYKYSSTGSTAGIITNSTSRPARTGSWYAWLNGFGVSTTQYIRQQVAIPSTACTAQLSFWIRIDTAETTTTTAYDTLKVQIRQKNADGTWGSWSTKATYSNLNQNTTYTQKTFDLAAYKGKTIQIRFYGKEDSSLQTSFVIDDTAVNITQ